ncbi:MAG: hypothetical protein JSW60_00120 [Thermoplasmatales archaeon]|nr:MAG: hypothetical protein JSW60_00120 [Thermoplasmatales archaeon]
MDVLSVIIGIIIGVVSVGFAIELGMKRTNVKQPASRPTHKWSISEITNPRIVAEHMGDMEVPKNAKIVVNQYDNKDMFRGRQVKEHSGIRGNFVLGDDRALILAGPIKEDELGIWTIEKEMLEKLNRYFEDSWYKATNMKHEEQ